MNDVYRVLLNKPRAALHHAVDVLFELGWVTDGIEKDLGRGGCLDREVFLYEGVKRCVLVLTDQVLEVTKCALRLYCDAGVIVAPNLYELIATDVLLMTKGT